MPLGNDIVDLKNDFARQKYKDPRYVQKVLTKAEQNLLIHSTHPMITFWTIWILKETTFKMMRQIDANARFKLKQDCIELLNDGIKPYPFKARIYSPYGIFFAHIDVTSDYVHAIGADSKKALKQSMIHVDFCRKKSTGNKLQSNCLRKHIKQYIARYHQIPAENIEIIRHHTKHGLGPPAVYIAGKKSRIEISMSHDGNWIGFALRQ